MYIVAPGTRVSCPRILELVEIIKGEKNRFIRRKKKKSTKHSSARDFGVYLRAAVCRENFATRNFFPNAAFGSEET